MTKRRCYRHRAGKVPRRRRTDPQIKYRRGEVLTVTGLSSRYSKVLRRGTDRTGEAWEAPEAAEKCRIAEDAWREWPEGDR